MKCILCLMILIPLELFAQVISVEQCIQRALEKNPELAIGYTEYEKASSQVKQASSQFLPHVEGSASYQRQSTVPELQFPEPTSPGGGMPLGSLLPQDGMQLGSVDQIDTRLQIAQPIFTGFRLRRQKEARQKQVHVQEQQIVQQKRELMFRVYEAYGNVLQAQNMIQVAETRYQQMQAHLEDVKTLQQQGMARNDQVLRVKVKLAEAELAIVKARNGLDLSRAALENVMGESLPQKAQFQEWQISVKVDSLSTAMQRAVESRSEIRALYHMKAAVDLQTSIAKGKRWPTLSAFGVLGCGKPGLDFVQNEWMDYWIVGIKSQWNLWDWGETRSRVEQAQLASRQIDYRLNATRDAIALDVKQAWFQWQEAGDRLRLTQDMKKYAQLSFEIVNNSFKQGMATQTNVLDAQSELTQASTRLVKARIDHHVAAANLARAMESNNHSFKE